MTKVSHVYNSLCDAWLDRELEKGESVVDCADEPYFSKSYDLHTGDARFTGGDVLEYTVLKK